MPENRPSIPLDAKRAIFVEAGHRCACCGIPFPLERAHIVPWSKSQDHSNENLLCLCANCHEMADRDWDRKTFYAYKANPWVNRHFTPPDSVNQSTPKNDALAWYMATAREILNHFSELQRLLAENDVDQAEIVMQSIVERARLLYDLGVALRARTPKLNVHDLTVLDRVYEAVARILNEKQGNIFTVADAICSAEKHLDERRVAEDKMA